MTEQTPEIPEKPIPPEVVSEIPPNKNCPKIILLVILGLVIVVGAVYAGIKIGKKQVEGGLFQRITPTSIPQPTPIPTSIPTPDETANWKTYENENFTFKYPLTWIEEAKLIRGSGFSQTFLGPLGPHGRFTFSFSSYGNYNQLTGKPYTNIDEFIGMPYQVKSRTVDGQEGRQPLPRAGSENINSVDFFSKDQEFIYELSLQTITTDPGTDIQEGQNLFNQILSTFKFLPAEISNKEIKNWKTLKLKKLEFKIPSSWWFEEGKNETSPTQWFDLNPTDLGSPRENGPAYILRVDTKENSLSEEKQELIKMWSLKISKEDMITVNNVEGIVMEGRCVPPEGATSPGHYCESLGINSQSKFVFFVKDKDVYLLMGNTSIDNEKIFDQILSTFKFLDTSCISADQAGDRLKGDKCCAGLKDVLYPCSGLSPDCICSKGGGAIHCTNCGNGICDKFESKCTCLEDCK